MIVFDLDGTLIDSARDLAESASKLVQRCGGGALGVEEVVAMVGDGAATLVARSPRTGGPAARHTRGAGSVPGDLRPPPLRPYPS
ncbi:MAG: HAD hydrolase-like protein [Vicinamibacterales bacterium]